MTRFARGLACLAASVAASVATAAPQPADREGPWQILSTTEAPSGRFDHCAVEAQFADGLVLAILRDRAHRAKLSAELPGRPMKIGAAYASEIAIDRGFRRRSAGTVETPTSFAVAIDGDTQAALARGAVLGVDTPKGLYAFALDGAGAAIAELARCVAAGTAYPGGKPRPADELGAVLEHAAAGPIQISRAVGTTDASAVEYAWVASGVAAAAQESTIGRNARFVDLVLGRMDRLTARCQGRFAPELEAPVERDGVVFEEGIATCSGTGEDRSAALLYYRNANYFIEFVLEAPTAERKTAAAARDQIAAILRSKLLPGREQR